MGSKISSDKSFAARFLVVIYLILINGLAGCALKTIPIDTTSPNELPVPEIVGKPGMEQSPPDSRVMASHSLTREGYTLLDAGDVDAAIRVLERAVSINPSDGPGYYYLAEAWIGKQNYTLALQFNRLAGIYLRANPRWAKLAAIQENRIEALMRNPQIDN